MSFTITQDSLRDLGICKCCGQRSMLASGWIFRSGHLHASYHVHWTKGRVPEHGANIQLILGDWLNEKGKRHLVVVEYRTGQKNDAGQLVDGFMITDAPPEMAGEGMPAAIALRRGEVIGTPLATEVFAIVDELWLHDDRLAEIAQPSAASGENARHPRGHSGRSWWRKLWDN